MTQRTGLFLFVAAACMVAVGYAACFLPGGAPPGAAWLLALGTATIMVAAMMVGALRTGRTGGAGLLAAFACTWLIIFSGFALALLLPPDTAGDALWLGLPRRAAIVIYGVGLLPVFVLPFAYARTFDRFTLSDADLQRVRAAASSLQSAKGDA